MATRAIVSSVTRTGRTEPFNLQVSRGQITGHVRDCPFGYNDAVGSSPETVWSVGGTYTFPAAATVLTVVSASANDDGDPVGTGARTVTIEGLDADYAPVTETVIMNGTSAVTTTASFLRVNKAFVATCGSTGSNVGAITIANTTPTTLASIAATAGVSEQCVYTVPANHTAYITRYMLSSYNSTSGAATAGQIWVKPFGGANMLVTTVRIPGTYAYNCGADYPLPVTEMSDIDVRAVALGGSSNVSAQLQMVVIRNFGS